VIPAWPAQSAALDHQHVKAIAGGVDGSGQGCGTTTNDNQIVEQEINRAVNQLLEAHPEARIVYENLSVASMRFHARSMNASQLGHLPKQLAWAAAKRGMAAHAVNETGSKG
jgi:hypothetical protein